MDRVIAPKAPRLRFLSMAGGSMSLWVVELTAVNLPSVNVVSRFFLAISAPMPRE
jgi:hypothetical protein